MTEKYGLLLYALTGGLTVFAIGIIGPVMRIISNRKKEKKP